LRLAKFKCERLARAQRKVEWLIEHRTFSILSIMFILLNTIIMSMDYYESPALYDLSLDIGNKIMTCIFAAEMILKIFGYGIKRYVQDGFNDFDAIIVIVGMLDFFNVGSSALTVLRCFRLLRIFKIVRSWVSLRKILQTVISAFPSIANLGVLMALLIFIYSLLGMQFFSGVTPENEDN
jgi:voltage-dependent calcium channel L type alpha-1S